MAATVVLRPGADIETASQHTLKPPSLPLQFDGC